MFARIVLAVFEHDAVIEGIGDEVMNGAEEYFLADIVS